MDGSWFFDLRNITKVIAFMMIFKYFIFLMIAPWYRVKLARQNRWLKMHAKEERKNYNPLITVIVPAWNEEVGIFKTLESLLKNDYNKFEVIVVNDGSTDRSHELVKKFLKTKAAKSRHPHVKIRYFFKENGGKGTALNFGIKKSSGEIIVTMDADSIFAPNALRNIANHFRNPQVSALVGQVKVAHNGTLIGFLQKMEYQFGFYYKRAHCVMGAEYIYGGACAAFRKKEVFDDLGHFDHLNKTEDIELSMRTKYYGLKSVYAEDVICYTEGASSLMGLINQRLRWKKGRFDTFLRYRSMFFSRHKHHNKALTWFVLPYSMLSEFQLLIEPIGITLLLTYSFISGDYVSLALGCLFMSVTYLVNGLFAGKVKLSYLLLFFVTWPLFYILVWVEYLALIRSLGMLIRGEDITWQKWQRKGVAV